MSTQKIYVVIDPETAGPAVAFDVESDALAYAGRSRVEAIDLLSGKDAAEALRLRGIGRRVERRQYVLSVLKQHGITQDDLLTVPPFESASTETPTDAELVEMGKLYLERARRTGDV